MSTLLPSRDKRLSPVPAAASMYHYDPLLHLDRQTKYVQHNLQALIDAQSESLIGGLTRPDGASDGSFTPTSSRASRVQSPPRVSSRRPSDKNIGLRAARRGILGSIYDLLKLRQEEREILSAQVDERDNALHEIEGFASRRGGLEDAISNIHNDQESQQAKHLRDEARGLETDIHDMETRLYEMKAKHRHLISEISGIENSVDAKLSSYTESLSLLRSDIRNYLRNPPVQPLLQRVSESTFYSLNHKRRTLEMAREHWKSDQEHLQIRQHEVDLEILALEEGGGVWKQAMADVSGFEKRLRVNMRHYIALQDQATGSDAAQNRDAREEVAGAVAEDLDKTTKRLEAHLELSEDKDWKLLVCCIAAELEALREAREMLLPAFGLSVSSVAPATPTSPSKAAADESTSAPVHTHTHEDPLGNDNPDPPADLLKDGDDHPASRSEDDDPDPSWL